MANPTGKGGFKRGQSGNVKGRPKTVGYVQELARQHTEEAISTIADLLKFSEDESVRIRAAEALLSRAWGRPRQEVEIDATKEFQGTLLKVIRNNDSGSSDSE